MLSHQAMPTNSAVVDGEHMEQWFAAEGPRLHRIYSEETYFSSENTQFLPGPEPPIENLRKTLVLYQKQPNQLVPYIASDIDIFDCSWEQVLYQLEVAKSNRTAKSGRKCRRADEFLAKASPFAKHWLELLPDEYGLSVVRGGLALIFMTAGQKVENHDKIIQAFEEIPDMIRTMEIACNLFGQDDEHIKEVAKSFYDQLCLDIPVLIHILDGKGPKFKRFLNRMAVCAPEADKIEKVLERINTKSKEMDSAIRHIQMKLDAKSRAEIDAMIKGLSLVYNEVRQLPKRTDYVEFARSFQESMMDTVRKEVRSSVQDLIKDQQLAHTQSLGGIAAEVKTLLLHMTQENESLKEANAFLSAQNRQIGYQYSRQASPIPAPIVEPFDLLQIMEVDPNSSTEELRLILRQSNRMSEDDKGRARWLMKTPQFHTWVNSPSDSLLQADGSMGLQKISPMSVLTGTLAISFAELPSTVTVFFFCGNNLEDSASPDSTSGPRGMLRSLITQLLVWFRPPLPNLGGVDSHQFVHDLHARAFPALCEVFRILVEQIPTGTRFCCLIDGVSWYEQDRWVDDMRFFVGMFRDMMNRPRGPVKTMLLTSPHSSAGLRDMVDLDREYVSLAPGNIDYTPLMSHAARAAMAY
ncbi:hypothetical protein F4778DRAFT_235282 [Xylariomycetidae sp. FL2044]|nr:hypothetical protein F4778DRAFT_235282 [Xylariomycetidae sp. FL2044]